MWTPKTLASPVVQAGHPAAAVLGDLVADRGDRRDQQHDEQHDRDGADEVDDRDRGAAAPATLLVEVLDSGDERECEEDGDDEHRHEVARLVHGPQRGERQEDDGDRPPHRADGDDDLLDGGRVRRRSGLWRGRR